MRSVISTLIGLFLYAQVIYGGCQCNNEYWLQSTQSSCVPEGHTHEIPESEQVVVLAYHEDCPQCICTMRQIVCGGGAFWDVTESGIKGIINHYEERVKQEFGPKDSNNEKSSSGKLYPKLPDLSHSVYPTAKPTKPNPT